MSTDEGRASYRRILPGSRRLRLLAGILLLMGFGLSAHSAHAQTIYTFTVNTTADTHDATPGDGKCDDASGNCSVRAGVEEANALPQPAGTQTIVNIQIPGGTYVLTLGELDLLHNTIKMTGGTISGNNASRVFYIDTKAIATLQNMTITQGNGTGKPASCTFFLCPANGQGGGIYSNGPLTLFNDVVSNNTATASGNAGSCFNFRSTVFGGGLAQVGFNPLTIQTTTFSGNKAIATGSGGYACGGGLYDYNGTSSIRSSTFTNNLAQANYTAQGGAIVNDEQEKLANDTISNNQAVVPSTSTTAFSNAIGGGIWNDFDMQIDQSTISNNQAIDTAPGGSVDGGGIDSDDHLSIFGASKITGNTVSGATFASGGGIENDDRLLLSGGVIVSQNAAITTGTSGKTTTCTATTNTFLTFNACTNGGGITNFSNLNMQNVSITNNRATAGATGTGTSSVAEGGGLINFGSGAVAQNVNIANNSVSASAPVAANALALGGGIWNLNTPLNLQNSFVQNNSSQMDGGGIYDGNARPGLVSLSYSRVTGNVAGHKGGGVFNTYPISRTSSPIFANSAPICPNIVVPCT